MNTRDNDNEIIVHFVGSKVVHLSSLANGLNLPSVDGDGDSLMFAPLVERALAIFPLDVVIGDKLLEKGRAEEAVAMLELSLAEYPDSSYAYYVNYDLALAHQKLGNRGAAIRCCRRALELSPENEMVACLLRELLATG